MMVTKEGQNTVRKTYPNATFSNIYYTWTILGSNPILFYKKPTANQSVSQSSGPILEYFRGEYKMGGGRDACKEIGRNPSTDENT